ncbi:hypothetical protein SFA35_26130 (plasmid) [Pseudomonas sp. HR96]|uniref:hypothetical protein n=1 Tax=Pseudomonas sp. HR96 TaxID=1027966 RepID=UPI002A748643|nr:hypothetical protein [Pseudomonas sp. HR96]WPP02523.1 hypothetical protein SFA35_26130 [Pseudomonas sp. HR96]
MNGILKLGQNQLATHPDGGTVFGVIPAIDRFNSAEAVIYLKGGFHRQAPNRPAAGYGIQHIWEGKKKELRKRGCHKADDIPQFIANLIVLGAEIYHDPNHDRASMKRITILRTSEGTLVLEPVEGDRTLKFHYSIVTWTSTSKARGIQVGVIEKKQE